MSIAFTIEVTASLPDKQERIMKSKRSLSFSKSYDKTLQPSESLDLSTYHFTGAYQRGLAPLDSFDHTLMPMPSTAAQLTQSYGSPILYSPTPTNTPKNDFSGKHHHGVVAPQVLTWRLDPDESLSDWTLTVVSNPELAKKRSDELDEDDDDDSDQEEENRDALQSPRQRQAKDVHPAQKYFVHRTQLAVGPRRSEYFAKLFRKKHKKSNGTRIELRPSAAAAFPDMLDFLYSPMGTLPNTNTHTAVALRHLATCFGIRELFDAVTEFIKLDLSPETAPTYLLEADAFSHEKLLSAALKQCAQNFESIKFSRIVTLSPPLLEEVVTSPLLEVSSRVLSSRIASYCRCRPGSVDAVTLQHLTHPDRMPEVAPEESLFFLHLIAEVDEEGDEEESLGGRRLSGKHSLYDRCLEASTEIVRVAVASKESKKKSSENRPVRTAVKEYYSLPAAMRVDLLEHALQGAPTAEDIEALEQARQDAKKKHASENNHQLQQLQDEVDKMRRKYEKKLASQEARIVAQEQEISAYANELSKFMRVPVDHAIGPVPTDHTYSQIPEFDQYGDSLYGEVPPTALPRFGGSQQEDGWVYHETRWRRSGKRSSYCWPMYFYKGE